MVVPKLPKNLHIIKFGKNKGKIKNTNFYRKDRYRNIILNKISKPSHKFIYLNYGFKVWNRKIKKFINSKEYNPSKHKFIIDQVNNIFKNSFKYQKVIKSKNMKFIIDTLLKLDLKISEKDLNLEYLRKLRENTKNLKHELFVSDSFYNRELSFKLNNIYQIYNKAIKENRLLTKEEDMFIDKLIDDMKKRINIYVTKNKKLRLPLEYKINLIRKERKNYKIYNAIPYSEDYLVSIKKYIDSGFKINKFVKELDDGKITMYFGDTAKSKISRIFRIDEFERLDNKLELKFFSEIENTLFIDKNTGKYKLVNIRTYESYFFSKLGIEFKFTPKKGYKLNTKTCNFERRPIFKK